LHNFNIIHGDIRAVRPRIVIYPNHSFYFRVTSYALKGIVIYTISVFPRCPRYPRLLPSHKWSTVVGRHQNWITSRAVRGVIFSRLHAQFTRFLSISLIYRRYSHICAHKMFTQQPPYKGNSTANDRSKPPRRTGRLNLEEWNKLWEILEVCWSTYPLDRPSASALEAWLHTIFQPRSMAEGCESGISEMPAISQMVHSGGAAQELDQQPRSKWSDILSFACTIYEVLVYYFLDLSSLFTKFCALDLYPANPL
jgi:hypothetical protein